jgi:hypothetical protein
LDGSGSIPGRARLFSSLQRPDQHWGLHSLLSCGYWGALSPGVKRQRREVYHSPPSNAVVKKGGAIPLLPHMSSWDSA